MKAFHIQQEGYPLLQLCFQNGRTDTPHATILELHSVLTCSSRRRREVLNCRTPRPLEFPSMLCAISKA